MPKAYEIDFGSVIMPALKHFACDMEVIVEAGSNQKCETGWWAVS